MAVSNKYIDTITSTDAIDGSGGTRVQTLSGAQLRTAANAPRLAVNAKTVGLSASRIYDGSEDLIGSDVTITTGVGGGNYPCRNNIRFERCDGFQ